LPAGTTGRASAIAPAVEDGDLMYAGDVHSGAQDFSVMYFAAQVGFAVFL